jgi:hypothetical protein
MWNNDCQTAAEVRARYREILVRKRESRIMTAPKKTTPVVPPPQPPVEPIEPPKREEISTPKTRKIKTILMLVRDHRDYWFTWEDIRARKKLRALAYPRQEMMWLMFKGLSWSLPTIGRTIERDHTTVLHGIRQVDDRRQHDLAVRERLDEAMVKIREMMEKEHPDE